MEQPQAEYRDSRATSLVRAAQAGDKMAVGDLLDLLTPYVRRLCGPIALDEGADATQEALIVIFRNLGQLHTPEALFGWVRTIAVREAVRVAKRRGSHGDLLTELPSPGDPQLDHARRPPADTGRDDIAHALELTRDPVETLAAGVRRSTAQQMAIDNERGLGR